jgi:autotransporter-associated beta strand protein
VFVSGNGTFMMNGGEISGNTSSYGGGVYVNDGTFTMNGGEISGNTA